MNYGDGKKATGKGAEPRTETHKFSKTGTYSVKLTITDAKHKSSGATAKITVKAPPAATPTPTVSPTVAPTATTSPTPAAGPVAITSIVDPIAPGSTEHATATSKAYDSCDLEVTLPSGRQSTASGLGPQTTDSTGAASWSWAISSNTGGGSATATLTCGAGNTSRTFTIS